MDIKAALTNILPDKLKALLQPYYAAAATTHEIVTGDFGGFRVAYRKGTADESVIGHSFENDIFFRGVPEYKPKKGHTIIDLGAHIGTFSLLASQKTGGGKVYAIEACHETFDLLKKNVVFNHCGNISVHNIAMAGANGVCTLYHDLETGNWGHSTVRKLSSVTEEIECCTLSTFMDQYGIDKCDFMKLNIEGAEFPVLLNAPASVLARFGAILVLYHCDIWTKNNEKDLIAHLESCGFRCNVRQKTEKRGWIIAINEANLNNK